jgi:hypothetical protein
MITLFDRKGTLGMCITIGCCFPFDIVPLPLVDAILAFVYGFTQGDHSDRRKRRIKRPKTTIKPFISLNKETSLIKHINDLPHTY